MKAKITTTLRRLSLLAGLFTVLTSAAPAVTVSINHNAAVVAGGDLVAGARIRASSNAWDMGLSNGSGFAGSNARRSNLAQGFTTPGRDFSFQLEHRAGEGFIFTVRDNNTNRANIQAWGQFASPPVTANLVSTLGGLTPDSPFDALQINARATLANARTTFSNLMFTSADLDSTNGSFYGGSLTRTTAIGSNSAGTATQNLLADVNLSNYSWTLSGDLTLIRQTGRNGANDVSLTINMVNVAATAATIPEPAGLSLAGAVLAGAVMRRRRSA